MTGQARLKSVVQDYGVGNAKLVDLGQQTKRKDNLSSIEVDSQGVGTKVNRLR
jgi:hypothetical protein